MVCWFEYLVISQLTSNFVQNHFAVTIVLKIGGQVIDNQITPSHSNLTIIIWIAKNCKYNA